MGLEVQKSATSIVTYLIGAAVAGLFVFVLQINANQAGQAEFNKNQTVFNENVLLQFKDLNVSIETLAERINTGTVDRFTRREAELSFQKNAAELKLWTLQQLTQKDRQETCLKD